MSDVTAPGSTAVERINERHHRARQRGVMTAADFIQAVQSWARGGGEPPAACLVRRVRFTDVVDLRGLHCRRRLDLGEFYFEVAVDLRDSRIDGPLMARDAVFEFGLHLGGSRTRGAFDATAAIFERPDTDVGRLIDEPGSEDRSLLDLDHATVLGDVTLDAVEIEGTIDFNGCRVAGGVFLNSLQASGHVDLRNAVVSGSVSSLADSGAARSSGLPARAGALWLGGARLRGGLVLEGFLGGALVAAGLEAGAVSIRDAILPSVELHGSRVRGRLQLTACTVAQQVDLRNVEVDELVVAGCMCGGLTVAAARVRRVAWFLPYGAAATTVLDQFDAYALTVGMDLKCVGLQVLRLLDLRNARLGALDLVPGVVEPAPGGFDVTCCELGQVDARGAIVDGNATVVARIVGEIDLTSATVRGRLSFRASTTATDVGAGVEPDWFEWIRRNHESCGLAESPAPVYRAEETRAQSARITLRLLTCSGDVDLADVVVRPAVGDARPVSLDASGAEIKGSLLLCLDNPPLSAGLPPRFESGDGAVLLVGARLGHLLISGESFAIERHVAAAAFTWRHVDAGRWLVRLLASLAWAGAILVAVGAVTDGFPYREPSAPFAGATATVGVVWKHLGVAALLAVLGTTCWREATRILRCTVGVGSPAGRTKQPRVAPGMLASHHLLQLHGVDHRELELAWRQALVRLVLATATCTVVAWPYLRPASASPDALLIPLLAVAALVLWGYVNVFLATCHARDCAPTWSRVRVRPARPAWSALVLACARALKNGTAMFLAVDAWAMACLVLALIWTRRGTPAVVAQHPFVALLAFVLVPTLGIWGVRWVQLALKRRLMASDDPSPVPVPVPGGLAGEFARSAADGAARQPAAMPERRPRPDVAGLSLKVMTFRDVMQVMTWNVIKAAPYQGQAASLDLDRAVVGDLEILKPIPRYVGIANLSVQRWRIDSADDVHNTLEVLDHAAEFKADMYQKVAETLRNAGQRADAEVAHRAARRQARWRESRWSRTALSLLHGLSGYGTHRGPLLAVMGLWFVFTGTWFAAEYEHVLGLGTSYAVDALQVDGCRIGAPDAASADCADLLEAARRPLTALDTRARIARGFSVALRYHVPIVPWDMYPFAQPATYTAWAYTAFVTAFHWVLWPLLLASLIPTLLPRGSRE